MTKMTIINLEEKGGVWFDMEGGGRVQIKTISSDEYKAIRKQTARKKIDCRKVEGTPHRFEYEEVNEDLQNELFWDAVIIAWENLYDRDGEAIPCTKENKALLMNKSPLFARFVSDCLKTLTESEAELRAVTEKNS